MNTQTKEQIELLRTWIRNCAPGKMVFLGGAGVSTESGIPDFRSVDGLYNQQYKYPPERIISRSFFDANSAEFYRFYCDRMLFPSAEPNAAHKKLAQLERNGILNCIVTQNIDGLHQDAGSKEVYELHGSVLRNYCMKCNRFYSLDELLKLHEAADDGVPHCECGGIVKPDVVLYEESLNTELLYKSIEAIASAELLLIAGTSLNVHPAAGLMDYFKGKHLAIINLSPTPRDKAADLCIAAKVGEVLGGDW